MVKTVKEKLVKRLRLCRESLQAGKLFTQLEKEKITEFAMHLKKLIKQAYPEEDSIRHCFASAVRGVYGLRTTVSRQLLLRDTFENAIEVAIEIVCTGVRIQISGAAC